MHDASSCVLAPSLTLSPRSQRSCTYYVHSRAGKITFTTIRKFRDDLTVYPPDHLICVPLVLDTLYNRVRPKCSLECDARSATLVPRAGALV